VLTTGPSRRASALFSGVVLAGAVAIAAGSATPALAAGLTSQGRRSVASVGLTGFSRTNGGVAHYGSVSTVHANVQILPKRAGKVTIVVQHRSGRSWKSDQTTTFTTSFDGTTWVGLSRGSRKVTYRFLVNAVADATGSASPTAISQSFMID
jgi:hypothetical protein